MLKKPGAFSNKYMSNQYSSRQSNMSKDKNKQNSNLCSNMHTFANNTLEHQQNLKILNNPTIPQQENLQTQQQALAKPIASQVLSKKQPRTSISHSKRLYRNQSNPNINLNSSSFNTKQKNQWQKANKQLQLQITKLKKENNKLKQDARRANKTNQENICSYEAYIKQIQSQRDGIQNKNNIYGEQLKYCILWIIEAFSLAHTPKRHDYLLQSKLGKNKMSQVFQKLAKTIQQLQLQKHLQQIAKNQPQKQQYLLYEKQRDKNRINHQPPNKYTQNDDTLQKITDLQQLLDTFDLRKEIQINAYQNSSLSGYRGSYGYSNVPVKEFSECYRDSKSSCFEKKQEQHLESQNNKGYQKQNIARRLFVNEDTFGEDMDQYRPSNQNTFDKEHSITQNYNYSKNSRHCPQIANSNNSNTNRNTTTNINTSDKNGGLVRVKKSYQPEDDDYLSVKKGDQVKLLRKVGGLWIAEFGIKIGYISEEIFN